MRGCGTGGSGGLRTVPVCLSACISFLVRSGNLKTLAFAERFPRDPVLAPQLHGLFCVARQIEREEKARLVFFFFGKTVILLTNNLHGRTRRRRGKHQGRGEGAESAAARRARPTRAGVSRNVGLRSRRCQAPLRARAREGWVLVDGYPGGPHSPQGCMWTRLGARHRGHLLFAACCM